MPAELLGIDCLRRNPGGEKYKQVLHVGAKVGVRRAARMMPQGSRLLLSGKSHPIRIDLSAMNFTEMGLHPDIVEGIESMRFREPTPIQQQAIPEILAGKDVIGIAQTGTGKTAAFLLPVLHGIIASGESGIIRALIVVPTRELALQIDQAIQAYAYFTPVSSMAIYGGGDGKDFQQEKHALVEGADIIIATPGRLNSHLNLGYADFSKVKYLILDEADRMLDMGFMPDLQRIIRQVNPDRQSLLFSATMPPQIYQLASGMLRNPVTINIALSKPAEGVRQGAYIVHDRQKLPLVVSLLRGRSGEMIIVFASTKLNVAKLYRQLKQENLSVGQISSDLEQSEREQVMQDFRNRKTEILVATDVVSRGIDIAGIHLVVNYDVPGDAEDYVHRVGRTARADAKGEAITLVGLEEQSKFQRIEWLIGSSIEKLPVPAELGEAPAYDPKTQKGGGGGKRPGQGYRRNGNRSEKPGQRNHSGQGKGNGGRGNDQRGGSSKRPAK